ncbi:MAG TPA: aldo/keto reductase [Jatrophihabitantaceae bacterium]|nr:aldo/keto reductase [Jatrophihabitantaceae bacterium]
MKQRSVGHSGLRVSQLGLGTMTWGLETDPDEAAAQLVAFREAGSTLIDTAVSYAFGRSEQIIGQLIADVVPRDEVVIATKAGVIRTEHDRTVNVGRGELLRRLDQSLQRLGTDYVDLWYVHYVDDTVPFDETLSALDTAVASGKARYVGVSNYCGWRTARAAVWQRAVPGRAPIVANQVRYSLLDRGVEREVIPASRALGVGVLPYSPLGGGVLTGKYRAGVPADSRAAANGRNLADIASDREIGIVEAVATAAEGLATSPIAVALAWVRDQPGVTAPILGARTLGQLTAALASEKLELPMEIRQALDDVSAPAIGYPEDVS